MHPLTSGGLFTAEQHSRDLTVGQHVLAIQVALLLLLGRRRPVVLNLILKLIVHVVELHAVAHGRALPAGPAKLAPSWCSPARVAGTPVPARSPSRLLLPQEVIVLVLDLSEVVAGVFPIEI